MSNLVNHKEYIDLLAGIKARIQSARIAASRSVNRELILLYWDIGRSIVERQKDEGWGKSVVEQLSKDIQKEFLGTTGYSPDNIWRMRQFYSEYSNPEFLEQLVPEIAQMTLKSIMKVKGKLILEQPVPETCLDSDRKIEFLQRLVGEIPWGHNILIMKMVSGIVPRLFYIVSTIACGWSRSVLLNQIKANAYERSKLGGKSHNFSAVMPVHLAEQTDEAMKSSYNLEFLGIKEPILERKLENRLISKLKDFILEKDSLEVEYSLKSKKNPIGVAEYQLRRKLPSEMKGMLPSPQEFETIKKKLEL